MSKLSEMTPSKAYPPVQMNGSRKEAELSVRQRLPSHRHMNVVGRGWQGLERFVKQLSATLEEFSLHVLQQQCGELQSALNGDRLNDLYQPL